MANVPRDWDESTFASLISRQYKRDGKKITVHEYDHDRRGIINNPLVIFTFMNAEDFEPYNVIARWIRKYKPELLVASMENDLSHFTMNLPLFHLIGEGEKLSTLRQQYLKYRPYLPLHVGHIRNAIAEHIFDCGKEWPALVDYVKNEVGGNYYTLSDFIIRGIHDERFYEIILKIYANELHEIGKFIAEKLHTRDGLPFTVIRIQRPAFDRVMTDLGYVPSEEEIANISFLSD